MIAGISIIQIILILVVIAGCAAVLYVVLQQTGVAIPPFVMRIFWIVVCVVLAILAIKFIAGLL